MSLPQTLQQALAYHRAGRLPDAEALYHAILQAQPAHAAANHHLGTLLGQVGQVVIALPYLKAALDADPAQEQHWRVYAETLLASGQAKAAHTVLQKAVQNGFKSPAIQALRQQVKAVVQKKPIKGTDPSSEESQQLVTLFNAKRYEALEHWSHLLLQQHPHSGFVWKALGTALAMQGKDGVPALRKTAELLPNEAEAHNNLAGALNKQNAYVAAEIHARRALEIKPDFAEAHNNLGSALISLGQLAKALPSTRRALKIKPDLADAHKNLGIILNDLGQFDSAEASFRRALEIQPDFDAGHSALLFSLSRQAGVDAQTLFAEHVRFAEVFEAPLRANWPQHTNTRDPARCLQVGFVSGDLKNHAVASFIEPVLAHLATCTALALHAYANHPRDDQVSLRLRGYFKHWHAIAGLPEAALAQKIIDDKIDVLIDLSGHTALHRLLAFTRKPAPLQATWIGYPGTTGLQAMDYYLTDRHCLPPGRFDHQFSEKLVYLPAAGVFSPFEGGPPVNALPAAHQGHLTLGSFNQMNKLSPSVIAVWSRLLRALPEAKMLLGGIGEGQSEQLSAWFAAEDIARERLNFHPRTDIFNYLALHQQVDFCLDTFPYNGGTTTFHAIQMGVPTLTLAGSTAAGRSGCTINGHIGLNAWVATMPDDFVDKGLFWASHLVELAALRSTLRERFAQSPLGQPTVVAAGLERALRHMWQRWCADLPAESFAADLTYVDTLSRCVQKDAEAP